MSRAKKLQVLFGSLAISLFVFVVGGNRAEAATVAVSDDCSLHNAIISVNNAANLNGCVKTGAAYGTEDTINLPAGTVTLSADLPAIFIPMVIAGAGMNQTTINANGNLGINSQIDISDIYQYDITIKDLKITGAEGHGIKLSNTKSVTLENVEVTDSDQGVELVSTLTTVQGCFIHDNTAPAVENEFAHAGLSIAARGSDPEVIPTVNITDTRVNGNISSGMADGSGIKILVGEVTDDDEDEPYVSTSVTVRRVSILNNKSAVGASLFLNSEASTMGTVNMELLVDATTIAGNQVVVTQPQEVDPGELHSPLFAGFYMGGRLAAQQNFTNVTIANNSVIAPAPDNRTSVAGFFGTLNYDGANLRITNTTVVGNSVTQPNEQVALPSFNVSRLTLDLSNYPTLGVSNIATGSSVENVLVARNQRNGQALSCASNLDFEALGFEGVEVDVTPQNLGHNMSDDQTCSGFIYEANLYNTIDHEVADNGGPVPTIKLLPGSPAVNAGGQVLGIDTDARGVAREGYYSVGAYQGALLASSTTNPGGGRLAETGTLIISSVVLGGIIIAILAYTYTDYRRHRKPLVEADPQIGRDYTYKHHLHTVTIPLLRYRLHVSVGKNTPKQFTKF